MKKRFIFKSIYAKFAIIFIGIWWFLHSLTFGVVMQIMAGSEFAQKSADRYTGARGFDQVKTLTGLTFLMSAVVGTILILVAVRGIVGPIKRISSASKEIAKGNFDIYVEPASRDEVGQLTTNFNEMARDLKAIDVLHKDFVANVSHEFKTPITAIMGYANLIREGQLSMAQMKEYGEIVAGESERLSLLSSNLLKLSELDSHLIREQAQVFSLDEQLRKTVLLLEGQWKKKNIEFDLDLEVINITAAEHLLQEVWLNLIQNAIKFSRPGDEVKIELNKQADRVQVKITDHGIGISEEDQPRIFERFFKGDKSRMKDGNGLGLVLVKKIVELSKGNISFVSTVNEGTTFTVELPFAFIEPVIS